MEASNKEMKRNIEAIKSNDPNAIIAIMGDHGPYLTNNGINMNNHVKKDLNQLDMQDRFGTFLAIHWPDKTLSSKYPINTIQDVMPAIMSYIYDDSNLFDTLKIQEKTIETDWFWGTSIEDSTIFGGPDNVERLFNIKRVRISN